MTDASPYRSDRVRQRRSVRSQQRLVRTTNYARSAAPVYSRAGMGVPVINRAATQPRRKYFVAISPNAELAMPSLPVIRFSWRMLSGLLAVGLIILMGMLLFGPMFQVKAVRFSGMERIRQAELDAYLGVSGKSIITVEPAAIQQKLLDHFPGLSAVAVSVGLPNNVSIAVRERQPAFVWKVKDKTYWIDNDGFLFDATGDAGSLLTISSDDLPPFIQVKKPAAAAADPAAANAAADAALLADPAQALLVKPVQQVETDLLKAAVALSSAMPANSTLVFSKTSGLGWTDQRGWKAYFGTDLTNIATKLNLYQSLVDQLTQKKIKPTVISVEQINAPFYRLER